MRCSCIVCGTYMIQAEGSRFGCVCPACLHRCRDCMGTNTVISRENLSALAARRADPGTQMPEAGQGDFWEDDEPAFPTPEEWID